MTREEQIKDFANSQIDCEFFDDSLYNGIIIGAKWADENPKEGMVSLDKVCEWLGEYMNDFCSECAEQALISWLRKAMEE